MSSYFTKTDPSVVLCCTSSCTFICSFNEPSSFQCLFHAQDVCKILRMNKKKHATSGRLLNSHENKEFSILHGFCLSGLNFLSLQHSAHPWAT